MTIALDPNYALAYAGLADAYGILWVNGHLPRQETVPYARAAALKALELDDTLGEAHAWLAFMMYAHDWDWAGAEREFRRAIELNPSYATAHQWYAIYLWAVRRMDEGMSEIKRAVELDPLSLIINTNLGRAFVLLGEYDQAMGQYRKTVEMAPDFAWAHWFFAEAYWQRGMYEEATTEYQKYFELVKDEFGPIGDLKHAYVVNGTTGVVQAIIEHLKDASKRTYVGSASLAAWYAKLGEADRAFEWLEKAYDQRDPELTFLYDPSYDSLRSDPRFEVLLRRIGLEP